MTANLYRFPRNYPEHLAPVFAWPNIDGPMNGHRDRDARCDIATALADQRTAFDWATSKQLAVLSVNADRNGAYLCVAPSPMIYTLFGEECAWIQRKVENGLSTELWLGCIGHIRVFWREVKCVH